ncbi:MAG: porin family protein [Rikenellaceae bacterium]
MKKIILSVAAICMMAVASVSAQEMTWGAKVGVNVAGITNSIDCSSRLGLVVGVTGEYEMSESSYLSADLLYSAQGNKYKYELGGVDCVDKYNYAYLNIPIMYNYYVVEGVAVKLGIQPGFLLGARWVEKEDDEKEDGKITGANGFDFAIPIGVSYDLSERLVLDARYVMGLSKIYDGWKGKNKALQITLGYKF